MARNLHPYDLLLEEEYIDMDISSATFLCYSLPSPPHTREFEFQMSSNPLETEHIASPADELFYKGNLLPLQLPPRLQMVQELLENSTTPFHGHSKDPFHDDSVTTTTTHTAAATPFESCNISPATSCYVSRELNPEDYFYECRTGFVQSHRKKSWSKKLKLGHKLRASKAYLKSLFTKTGCSEESSAVPKAKECSIGYLKTGKKNPFGQIQRAGSLMRKINGEKMVEEDCGHRSSFSGAIKRRSSNKSSSASSSCSSSNCSSFSSVNSNGIYGPQMLKRSSSANSEVENSIQGAIAYCKKSQQLVGARKSVSDVGFCTLSASMIAVGCEKLERPGIYRG